MTLQGKVVLVAGGSRGAGRGIAMELGAAGAHTNAGYGTRSHLSALASDGPCPFHRMTFSPLRQGLLDL